MSKDGEKLMTTSAPIDPRSVRTALWGTQASDGKGLARWDYDQQAHVWYELPNWAEKMTDDDPDKPKLGEPIHPEMGLIPANAAARRERCTATSRRFHEGARALRQMSQRRHPSWVNKIVLIKEKTVGLWQSFPYLTPRSRSFSYIVGFLAVA